MKREPGFYWVKYEGEWVVSEYRNDGHKKGWWVPGAFILQCHKDDRFEAIHKTRLIPPKEQQRQNQLTKETIMNQLRSAEEILQSKGIQFPASRSPRDYNLTLIAMEEYAKQFKEPQKDIETTQLNPDEQSFEPGSPEQWVAWISRRVELSRHAKDLVTFALRESIQHYKRKMFF